MLEINQANIYYGESHIVRNLSLQVGAGEAVAIMGRNGMGKTTLVKGIMGILPLRAGQVSINGVNVNRLKSYERVQAGLGYVPQGRMIFSTLSVEDNIRAGMTNQKDHEIPEYIYNVFPILKEMSRRRGGNLSGGQQQMLAIARALVARPKVLLLDEPTEGLQPSIIKEIAHTLGRLRAEYGFAIVVAEQVLSFALEVADRFAMLERGEIAAIHDKQNLDVEEIKRFLTV